jgi:hypothetical protein
MINMKSNFMNGLSRSFHSIGLGLRKHSPEILVVAGAIGTVVSAVVACKATTKLETVLEKNKKDIETINAYVEDIGYTDEYTEKDHKKDLTIVRTKAVVNVAKLYAPAVAIGAVSLTSIFVGHNILHKRNVALAAAYTAVDTSFKKYRESVVERFGKELDKELKFNVKPVQVEETVSNEDGTESTVTKTVEVAEHSPLGSEYARFFDEYSTCWTKNAEDNLSFLIMQQDFANKKLQTRGYLFLNEVYDMLGIQRSTAGQIVGWRYDKNGTDCGDNYVDFGIHNIYNKNNRLFVNGYERSILLDFNVDGPIYKYMKG